MFEKNGLCSTEYKHKNREITQMLFLNNNVYFLKEKTGWTNLSSEIAATLSI